MPPKGSKGEPNPPAEENGNADPSSRFQALEASCSALQASMNAVIDRLDRLLALHQPAPAATTAPGGHQPPQAGRRQPLEAPPATGTPPASEETADVPGPAVLATPSLLPPAPTPAPPLPPSPPPVEDTLDSSSKDAGALRRAQTSVLTFASASASAVHNFDFSALSDPTPPTAFSSSSASSDEDSCAAAVLVAVCSVDADVSTARPEPEPPPSDAGPSSSSAPDDEYDDDDHADDENDDESRADDGEIDNDRAADDQDDSYDYSDGPSFSDDG